MSPPRVPGDQVSYFSGYTYAQRPVSFTWNDRPYQVETVLGEWKTPDKKIFLVRTTSGEEFELVQEPED
jgi:hypothetical protein